MFGQLGQNKRIFNSKGMTLIELLVGLFVFSIIAVSVLTVLVSSLGAYMRARDYAEVNTLMDNLSALVMDSISGMTFYPEQLIIDDPAAPPPIPADPEAPPLQDGEVFRIFSLNYVVYSILPANDPSDMRRILWEHRTSDPASTMPVLEANFYRTISLDDAKLDVDEAAGIVTLTLTITPGRGAPIIRSYTARPVGLQA